MFREVLGGNSTVFRVIISGEFLYVIELGGTLTVVDISDPNEPVPIELRNNMYAAYDLAINDSYAYISSHFNDEGDRGTLICDISEPLEPVIVDTSDLYIEQFYANEGYLYGEIEGGLEVYSLDDPFEPELVAEITSPGNVSDLVVYEGLACVKIQDRVIAVINVENPDRPVEIDRFELPSEIVQMHQSDGTMIIITVDDSCRMFDIGEIALPELLSVFTVPQQDLEVTDALIYNNSMYVAASCRGQGVLNAFDITHRTEPEWSSAIEFDHRFRYFN